jgi:hypothetical protein
VRRAAKVDANHSLIVGALISCGATVQSLAVIGKGCPDILIGWKGSNYLVEIKDGSKPPSKRELNPDQCKWHANWRGHVMVIESVEQALAMLATAGAK